MGRIVTLRQNAPPVNHNKKQNLGRIVTLRQNAQPVDHGGA